MTAYGNMDNAVAGLLQGCDNNISSRIAGAAIEFGKPLFAKASGDGKGLPFVADRATLTFSADFGASNSVIVTVNGVATVAEVYATSHAATFAAVVAKVEALAGVDVVSSSSTARTITITTIGIACVASAAVTGGSAVTAAASFPGSVSLEFLGVTVRTDKRPGSYEAGDAINVLGEGRVSVPVAGAVGVDDPAYLTSAGVWTNTASGNMATGAFFRTSTTGAGFATLEIK